MLSRKTHLPDGLLRWITPAGMLCGRLVSFFFRKQSAFLIFPKHGVGGSEKVHADIAEALSTHVSVITLFTDRSTLQPDRTAFEQAGRVVEWPFVETVLWKFQFALGFWSQVINRSEAAVVFGANNYFFYRLLPFLKPSIRKVDLVHNLVSEGEYGMEHASEPFKRYLHARVVVSEATRTFLEKQNVASEKTKTPVHLVYNASRLPFADEISEKPVDKPLRVLFVARNDLIKRARLAVEVARNFSPEIAQFCIVGDFQPEDFTSLPQNVHLAGLAVDSVSLLAWYRSHDVILLTSKREGFPLVVVEGMAQGLVPVCVDVGGLFALVGGENPGFLVPNALHEEEIVAALTNALHQLINDPDVLKQQKQRSLALAHRYFSKAQFAESYRKILLT
jgi:glycosyltransferase involved in cell wall biosynthesis